MFGNNSGSEESADEEFTLLPFPPQLISGHFEDLEEALMSPDLQYTYQTGSNGVRNRDNYDDSHEKQEGSRDSSDIFILDDPANDAYSNEYALFQEEIMLTGSSQLSNLQIQMEQSYISSVEKRGIAVEMKEEREKEQKDSESTSQWEDEKVPPLGSTLDDGHTISASSDPENNEREGAFDEEFFVTPLLPSSAPEQLQDDDSRHPRLPPGYQTRRKRESHHPRCVKPKQYASCIFPYDLFICRLF